MYLCGGDGIAKLSASFWPMHASVAAAAAAAAAAVIQMMAVTKNSNMTGSGHNCFGLWLKSCARV